MAPAHDSRARTARTRPGAPSGSGPAGWTGRLVDVGRPRATGPRRLRGGIVVIGELLRMCVRWQAEAAVLGACLAFILVVAIVYAAMCRLVTWIWRMLGPQEVRRG